MKFKSAQFVSLLAFVLTLRFSLDGLFCGQISGWNYLFFTSSLYFLLRGRAVLGPWVLVVPTLLKLGPGILVLHTLRPRVREVLLFAAASAAFFLILHGALWAYVGEHSVIPMLWQKWQFIVSEDARYFNGATGRNQTLRGFLLRAFAGTYSLDEIQSIWKVLVVACCGLSFAWVVGILRQNWTARTVYLRFCVGILCLVIFMPQSLPYGWVHLSFPIAYFLGILLESREKGLAAWRSPEGGGLLLFFVCCSIPGPSLVGRDMAEWLLEHSVPFWVSLGVLLNCYRLMADQKVSELT